MAIILGLDPDKVYFHGCEEMKWKLQHPSIKTPMYISGSYAEASTYSYDSEYEIVFLVTIKKGMKMFNFSNGKQVASLKGKTIYADDTIDLLRWCYATIKDFNLWVLTHDGYDFIEGIIAEIKTSIKLIAGNDQLDWDMFHTGSPLFNVIHHSTAGGNLHKLTPEIKKECEDVQKICIQKGFKSVHEAVFSVCEDSHKDSTLLMKLYCDFIDAMADGTYEYNFMTFRRPLYKAILEMGYPIICDSSSSYSHYEEYVILSPEPIDRILNVPVSADTAEKYQVISDLRYILKHEGSLDKDVLYDLLEDSGEIK